MKQSPLRFGLRTGRFLPGIALLGMLAGPLGCQKEEPVQIEALEPREQLIRVSMDLRGRHPSEEELAAIEKSPELYDQFVDRYLQSPEFLDRMMEVFNQAFLTRTGDTYYKTEDTALAGVDPNALARSVGDEPLQLIRHIIENDLPYSEVVTADYTLADPLLAAWWGIDHPVDDKGWVAGHYLDGRPEAGVLSQETMWQRYTSAGGNANRHRANAVSRILLCDDFLTRPIVLNRTAIDGLAANPEDAIRNPDNGCQSCHSALDPLAGNFFGFFREDMPDDTLSDGRVYRPENELAWKAYSGKAPGYFGRPTSGLAELGQAIATDPRFVDCAVRTVFEGVTQRTATADDWKELQGLRADFEQSKLNIRSLVREIVRSDYYRARTVKGDEALGDRLATTKVVSPSQLAREIEDVTGYRWTFRGVDGLSDNALGLSVLSGGIDSKTVRVRAENPAVGLAFVQERLGQAAANYVVSRDFAADRQGDPRLMIYVTAGDRPEANGEAFNKQIGYLYTRITGIPLAADAPEPAELTALWSNVFSVSASPVTAWSAVVSAVLRDPRVLFY